MTAQKNTITIDGSHGEGGGQILRTSLGLAMLTGTPVRIENVRARREKPGLMRQHLAAVRAAAEVCGAALEGDELGSMTLSFAPGEVKPGAYRFAVGSAGSTTLVLQTLLPALLTAGAPSEIELEGGTHNPLAPPFDFFAKAFVPVVNRMGPTVEAVLGCPGFYPAGGGKCRVTVTPTKTLVPVEILERGPITRRVVRAMVAGLPGHIAQRELAGVKKRLKDWPDDAFVAEPVSDECGPGNVITAELESSHVTEVFTAFGKKGLVAEAVADDLAAQVRTYLKSDVPVGEHLADQLMIPLAMAAAQGGAGGFLTGPLSMHAKTNIGVIERFLSVKFHVHETPGRVQVDVRPA